MAGQFATPSEVLFSFWNAQHLEARTIRYRLRSFEMVGGIEADRFSVERYLGAIPHPKTRRQHLSQLRIAFRTAVALGLMPSDPTVLIGQIRVPRSIPKPLSDLELKVLLDEAVQPVRDYVVLGAYAGLRAGEIAILERYNLESYPGGWQLRIYGKGGHEGLIHAHYRVVEVMSAWEREPGLDPNKVSKRSHREFRRLGIDGSIHRARHSFATNALKASGGDLLVVRDLMRHKSVATTQVYTALDQSRPAAVVGMLA